MHWWARFSGGGEAIPVAAIADTYEDDQSVGDFWETSDTFDVNGVDPGPEDPFPVKDKMTRFVFGAPGEITFDASHGYAAFPVPTTTLVFASETEYLEYMEDVFNAEVVVDPAPGKRRMSLEVTTFGIPYTSDSSGTKLVAIDDPVNTFLGGPSGYYVVDGRPYCTDPDRCTPECLPPVEPANAPPSGSLTYSALPGSSHAVSLEAAGIMASAAPFDVQGQYFLRNDPAPTSPDQAKATIFTVQSSGAMPYYTEVCDPPSIIIDFEKKTWVMVPGACSTQILNPNRLTVQATFSSTQYPICKVFENLVPAPKTLTDVPRVSTEHRFEQFNQNLSLSGIKSKHIGDQGGPKVTRDQCWSAGCFKKDPCVP